jgi:hypothetical protein
MKFGTFFFLVWLAYVQGTIGTQVYIEKHVCPIDPSPCKAGDSLAMAIAWPFYWNYRLIYKVMP